MSPPPSCEDATDVGTGMGVAMIFGLWSLGFFILSIISFMTRPKGRPCPRCGEEVKRGRIECKACGYDFGTLGADLPKWW